MLRFQTREDGTTCSVRQSAEPPCEGPRAQSPGRGHCGHRVGTGRGSARPRAVAWTLCPAGEAQGPRRLEREAEVTSGLGAVPGGAWAGAQDKQPAVGGSPHPGAHARATRWPARGAKCAAGAGQARVAEEDAVDAHGHSVVRRAARPKSCNPGGWLGRVCVSGGRTRTLTGDGPQPRPPL